MLKGFSFHARISVLITRAMSSESLSDEQRARIERNRENAQRLRLEKQQKDLEDKGKQQVFQQMTSDLESGNLHDDRPSIAQRFNTTSLNSSSTSFPKQRILPNSIVELNSKSDAAMFSTKADLKSKYWSKDKANTDEIPSKTIIKSVFKLNYRFEVQCSYHQEAVNVFRSTRGSVYSAPTKTWSFPLTSYRELAQNLKKISTVSFQELPFHIINIFKPYFSGSLPQRHDYDLSLIDQNFLSRLFPFQRECIQFAISKEGRILIADDMGLGKTIEALGIISYYRQDWPVLIVCPASLRYTWKYAIMEWLSVNGDQIAVIDTGASFDSDKHKSALITITGYSLLKHGKDSKPIRNYGILVLDESHFIKSPDTKRTKACLALAKKAKRVILLSGTPALSRPKELFTQITAIKPSMFSSFKQFGLRYCDPQPVKVRGATIISYEGAENMEELEALLKETIMIRRVKEEVLNQLPEKTRGLVLLDSKLLDINKKTAAAARQNLQNDKLNGTQKHSALLEFYAQTATAKLKAATEYIMDLLENGRKFLVFAHHKVLLDHLHSNIAQSSHEVIRIDGSTPAAERKALCDRFQNEDRVRVALLSITASGTGLTLTAANLVVFAELFWNPGVLAQAEDRAHRVGQTDSVHVQYLVGPGTADDFIWPLIQKKLNILNKGGLSKGAFKTSETTRMESSESGQMVISDFLETICDDVLNDEGHFDHDNTASPRKKQRKE